MINRQLSRLLLCSILGSTTLISGCATWYARILHLINSSNRNKSNWPMIFILPAPAGRRRSGGNNSMTRSWMR